MFGSIFADSDVGAGVGPVSASGGVGANLAYGPGPGAESGSPGHPLMPSSTNGFAWGFWLGVGGLVVMIFIRHNLPS